MAEYVWVDSVGATRSKSRVSYYRPPCLYLQHNLQSAIRHSINCNGSVGLHATCDTLPHLWPGPWRGARLVPPRPHTPRPPRPPHLGSGHGEMRSLKISRTAPLFCTLFSVPWLWPSKALSLAFRHRVHSTRRRWTAPPLRTQHEQSWRHAASTANRLG